MEVSTNITDYSLYRQTQTGGNKRKLDRVWVQEANIIFLADYIKKIIGQPVFGICHGTRRGKEQEWFSGYLNCEMIGTEISDTAKQFPNTIQWDFHNIKPEWENAVDFIYSNSFDHSYDPQKCLSAWVSCIKKGGLCIIEHCSDDEEPSEFDPFGVTIERLIFLIADWSKGQYVIRELIESPMKRGSWIRYQYLIILQKL